MVAEILARQAELLSERAGQTFEEAFTAVLKTESGRRLAELADGPYRHRKACDWQSGLLRKRAKERLLHRVGPEAKEAARAEYQALGGEQLVELGDSASLRGEAIGA